MSLPVVVIVGRPNVGKSTLFNKIVGKRLSITDDMPGVTRDGVFSYGDWNGRQFMLIDTGGFEVDLKGNDIIRSVNLKTREYIAMSNAVIFLVDLKDGILPLDVEFSNILKKSGKPIFLCVNKCDSIGDLPSGFYEFYELFCENVFAVSAVHGHGVGDLLDGVVGIFKATSYLENGLSDIKVAVVGRPNVGKSSLINKVFGSDRLIVSDKAGTTRDCVDVSIKTNDKNYIFIDTAGVRKKSKIKENVERYSVIRSFMAIERADICVILVDAVYGAVEQDLKIAGYIKKVGKGAIVAINKWDLVKKDSYSTTRYIKRLKDYFDFMPYVPYIFISAKTGQRVDCLFDLIDKVNFENSRRISTGILNELLLYSIARVPLSCVKGKRLKIYYITQVSTKPPTFVIFVNEKNLFHFSYLRYLENSIRKEFGFIGTPIRFILREKK